MGIQSLKRRSRWLRWSLLFAMCSIADTLFAEHIYLKEIDADPAKGFHWPYLIYVPKSLPSTPTILVLPNNTGSTDDDFERHRMSALEKTLKTGSLAEKNQWVILRPIFPRPTKNIEIYTHALNRAAMETKLPKMERIDKQLIAMIDDVRGRLAKDGLKIDRKVLMWGFSASGSFVNRFVMIHPGVVKAAAIGSPGGWITVPTESSEYGILPFPLGVGDFAALVGRQFDREAYKGVPQFFYQGDQDNNEDSYTKDERKTLYRFGMTRIERWPANTKLIEASKCRCQFKLYPGLEHIQNEQVQNDVEAFFKAHTGSK